MDKNYYVIEFSASGCQIDIRVNDIPVANFEVAGQASTVVPINYAIPFSGEQVVTGRITALSGEEKIQKNAFLDFQVRCMGIDNGFSLKQDFEKYVIAIPEEESGDFSTFIAGHFHAEVPYEFAGWQDGLYINDIEDALPKLIAAYQRLAEAIENKDYQYFINAFRNRERIMNTAMYLGAVDSTARLEHYIEKFDSGFDDVKISENVIMQIAGGNRTVCLKKSNMEHALSVRNLALRKEILLDLMFYMPKGKTAFELI
ncbi:MAG: hypothetical protein ACN6ON_05610 [Sphingobacterium sp.]